VGLLDGMSLACAARFVANGASTERRATVALDAFNCGAFDRAGARAVMLSATAAVVLGVETDAVRRATVVCGV